MTDFKKIIDCFETREKTEKKTGYLFVDKIEETTKISNPITRRKEENSKIYYKKTESGEQAIAYLLPLVFKAGGLLIEKLMARKYLK
ncbi:MAG: hypothetical protein U0354_15545 [Candidatus Sericytochromatia bacterium]